MGQLALINGSYNLDISKGLLLILNSFAHNILGNFVCDLMRYYYTADCALMAAGTIRGDQIYPPGVIQLKDIMNCFPFEDPVVVLRVCLNYTYFVPLS